MVSEPKRPWWQATRTARWGFVLGGFWLVMVVLRWAMLDDDTEGWGLFFAWGITAMAVWFIVSAIALRRREMAEPTSSEVKPPAA